MKLIIEIPEERLDSIKHFGIKQNEVSMLERALISGTPLDDVKTEIMQLDYELESFFYASNDMLQAEMVHTICREEVLQILDNIGKAESEEPDGF